MSKAVIRPFTPSDPGRLHDAFTAAGWNKPVTLFERYLQEHAAHTRYAVLAEVDGDVAGYGTLVWTSAYPPFNKQGIPEVCDLNVLPHHRRTGIATSLLDHLEHLAAARSPVIGLGVGLYADYGAAQRIYGRRGYLPDGHGVMYKNQPVPPGETLRLDDDATLMLTKHLKPAPSTHNHT